MGEDPPARRHLVAIGADHHDVRGLDDRAQRPHGGAPVAQVGVVLQKVVGGQIELDAHDAVLEPVPMHQPDRLEHPEHRHVPGKGVGHQVTEPGGPSDQRQILQQHRCHALVVVGVGDGEGDLGLDPAWAGVVLADADDRTVGLGDQRDLLVDVLDGGSLQLVIGDEGPESEEPGVRGRVVELLVEGPQPLDITGTAGAHMNRPARRQQDVALERREQRRRGRRSSSAGTCPTTLDVVTLRVPILPAKLLGRRTAAANGLVATGLRSVSC